MTAYRLSTRLEPSTLFGPDRSHVIDVHDYPTPGRTASAAINCLTRAQAERIAAAPLMVREPHEPPYACFPGENFLAAIRSAVQLMGA